MSCAFLLRPSVWWAKREATQSAEPRVGPDRRLACARRGQSTRTLSAYAVELTWPERGEGVEDCRDERLEVRHAVGRRADK